MTDKKASNIFGWIGVGFLIGVLLGGFLGGIAMKWDCEGSAVKNKVAEYRVNPQTGEVVFVYLTPEKSNK